MSPEQMRGEAVDRRTDVFAAGIVLWELLTTERLFGGEDEKTTIGRLLMGAIAPPGSRRADIPPALDEVVALALERDVERRFPDASTFLEALTAAAPPASADEVGRWVESLCASEIAERRRTIASVERDEDLESDAPRSEDATGSEAASVLAAFPGPPRIATSEATPGRRVAPWIAVAASLAVAATAVAFAARRESVAAQGGTSAEVAASVEPPTVATASAVASVPEVEPATPTASASTSATTQPAPPVRRTPLVRASAGDCTNPYTFDAEGRKRYRRECLVK
jgi:serine/threonine-protein kinase